MTTTMIPKQTETAVVRNVLTDQWRTAAAVADMAGLSIQRTVAALDMLTRTGCVDVLKATADMPRRYRLA
jgi:hypothetical protein